MVTKEEATLDGGYDTRPIEADYMGIYKCKVLEDPINFIFSKVLRRWIKLLEDDVKKESS